jgi:lipoprotein-releasing system permease protein
LRYGLKIAFRHLVASPSQTGLLVLGVAIAVFIFIFMSALIGGLADLMVIRTLGNFAHVTVEQPDKELPVLRPGVTGTVLTARQPVREGRGGILDAATLLPVIEALDGVVATSPQIVGGGVLIRGEQTRQVSVIGLDPDRLDEITPFSSYLTRGTASVKGPVVLIGRKLAEDMKLDAGNPVVLRGEGGAEIPLRVSGIFEVGAGQLDSSTALVDIATTRDLFAVPQAVTRIEVKLADLYAADQVADRIRVTTGLAASPWTDGAEQLYEALRAQADTGNILKAFALITIVIGVASALMLSTYRRRPEIGIMRAMGATRHFILYVFVVEGALIGLAGGLLGAVLGFAVLSPFPSIDEVTPGQLPIDVAQGSIGLAILLTTLGATLAALLPARSASRVDPSTAIGQ